MRSRYGPVAVCSILVAILALGTVAAEPAPATRTFMLQHVELAEAVRAVEPLLSAAGSLTADSAERRLVVRDSPEVLARVAEVVASIDLEPEGFRIGVELLEASNTPFKGSVEARQDAKLSQMLRYAHFRVIGSSRIEGRVGDASSAVLASGYRVGFNTEGANLSGIFHRHRAPGGNSGTDGKPDAAPPQRRRVAEKGDSVSAAPVSPSRRILLNPLTVERLTEGGAIEVLRTRMLLAPGQQTVLAVSRSEDSDRALVLVVRAELPEVR